jgi:HAL2 family 3'(2'),5'-bisphosphate nucleotidase
MDPSRWEQERFQVALRLVEQACQMSRRLQEQLDGDFFVKVDSSPVTVADLAVQALIALGLYRAFPEDSILAEESTESLTDSVLRTVRKAIEPYTETWSDETVRACFRPQQRSVRRWILDPIDGTKGFLRGDQFAIALAHQNVDQIEFGLLGCPRLSPELADKGEGCLGVAFSGRGTWQTPLGRASWRKLSVSVRNDVTKARLLRSFEHSHTNKGQIERVAEALGITADPVRMDSQAKYLLLARGDAEAVMRCLSDDRPNYREKLWDQAAGSLLLTEAGGRVTDLYGKELDFSEESRLMQNVGVLGSNGLVHEELLEGLSSEARG